MWKYHSDERRFSRPNEKRSEVTPIFGWHRIRLFKYSFIAYNYRQSSGYDFVKKLPFYYSGKSSTNSHAWVLDGWLLRERRVITRYAFLPTQYHTESKEFVHANFGWGGQKRRILYIQCVLYRQGTCQPAVNRRQRLRSWFFGRHLLIWAKWKMLFDLYFFE